MTQSERDHLENLRALSPAERDRRIQELLNTLPPRLARRWPHGMPASIDPKLVLIGVSPGNAPAPHDDGGPTTRYVSTPTVDKPADSHFYYPDTRGYTCKLRLLALEYFRRNGTVCSEPEALAPTTHFNLGLGSAGRAGRGSIEPDIIRWVSRILNTVHRPDLVVMFGLWGILQDEEIARWWNEGGLTVDWRTPCQTWPFNGQPTYRYREWAVHNELGHGFRIVIWPNHPSRPPFTRDLAMWRLSAREYLDHLASDMPRYARF